MLKLGYFTMPLHPVGRDWRETLAEDREAVLRGPDGTSMEGAARDCRGGVVA